MAQPIETRAPGIARLSERPYPELWKLRLALSWVILFAVLVGLFAISWDVQWHTAVGRDRTLTAPHLFILGSITLTGITALTAVLIETMWARRNALVANGGTIFADFFSSSLGAYLAGYGALASAIAFPLDQYWHTLYGIDVTLWAPFHIMALVGLSVSCLGVTYMLAESAHLAARQGAQGAAIAGYVGVIVALAILMGVFSFLLIPSLSQGYIFLGHLTFTVYPLMLGALGTFVLITALQTLPWRTTATSVAVIYFLFGLINYLIIPPLMTWLLGVEQQSFLPNAPQVSVIAVEWQYSFIIAAVLLDIAVWVAHSKKWSLKKTNGVTIAAALIGVSLAALFNSRFLASAEGMLRRVVRLSGNAATAIAAHGNKVVPESSTGLSLNALVIVIISLLLGMLGTYVGYWLGGSASESIQKGEQ